MTPAHAPADAPAWVLEALAAGHPVVVRRAVASPGQVAVGVRGRLREQRFAAVMPMAAVQRRVVPEDLRGVISPRDLPALQALAQLRPVLAGESWGVTGSAGFELASGVEAALNAAMQRTCWRYWIRRCAPWTCNCKRLLARSRCVNGPVVRVACC
eukprot:gene9420-14602_t